MSSRDPCESIGRYGWYAPLVVMAIMALLGVMSGGAGAGGVLVLVLISLAIAFCLTVEPLRGKVFYNQDDSEKISKKPKK